MRQIGWNCLERFVTCVKIRTRFPVATEIYKAFRLVSDKAMTSQRVGHHCDALLAMGKFAAREM